MCIFLLIINKKGDAKVNMKEEVLELQKEMEQVKYDGFQLAQKDVPMATEVLHLMKKSLKRTYALLIIFICLFVFSIIDSIYQRCRIIDMLEQIEVVHEIETHKNIILEQK